jgi:hypothetical protein
MRSPRRRVTAAITAFLLSALGLGLVSAQPAQAVSLLAAPRVQTGPGHTRASDLPMADTAHRPVGVHALKGRPASGRSTSTTSTTSTASIAATRTSCPAGCYFYSSFSQGPGTGLLAGGAAANFSVQNTYLNSTDSAHSLGEIALTGHNAGGTQVVEAGITTDPTVNGDLNPHLFVFAWINGVGQCYNGCGWTRTAGSTVTAGMSMTAYLGTVINLTWQHFPAGANGQLAGWYAWFQPSGGTGQWFGLFPDSMWTARKPRITPPRARTRATGSCPLRVSPPRRRSPATLSSTPTRRRRLTTRSSRTRRTTDWSRCYPVTSASDTVAPGGTARARGSV